MKPENNHPRSHRQVNGLWSAALVALLFAGSGAALAENRRGDRDAYREHDRSEEHRATSRGRHEHRGDDRVDRRRNRRDDHRYDRLRRDPYRHNRQHHGYRNHYRTRHFAFPRVILHELLHTYSPYRHGRLYHAQHRHYHEVYRFPVYAGYGVEYYPYAYCEGKFFGRGAFHNGRAVFDVRISF